VKPHHAVRIGDVIVVELPHQRRRLIVRALGERRGPPAEAKLLYEEPTPPVALETYAPGWVSLFEEEVAFET
jgi:ribosome-associated heat shock protein Hsp15